MLEYPSIAASTGTSFRQFPAYVFDKLDGSNLRFEWNRKKGWVKSGTRTRLFDESDSEFAGAIAIFHGGLADPLGTALSKAKIQSAVVFCEWHGPNSFAGLHEPNDEMSLTLFDVAVPKKGLVSPKEFLKTFGHLPIPKFLGQVNWTRQYIQDVAEGRIAGISFEGVVGKSNHKRGPSIMAKAKTTAWIDRVKARYSAEEAERIIQS